MCRKRRSHCETLSQSLKKESAIERKLALQAARRATYSFHSRAVIISAQKYRVGTRTTTLGSSQLAFILERQKEHSVPGIAMQRYRRLCGTVSTRRTDIFSRSADMCPRRATVFVSPLLQMTGRSSKKKYEKARIVIEKREPVDHCAESDYHK